MFREVMVHRATASGFRSFHHGDAQFVEHPGGSGVGVRRGGGLNTTSKGQHNAVVAGSRPGAGLFSGRYFGAQYGWQYRAEQLAHA